MHRGKIICYAICVKGEKETKASRKRKTTSIIHLVTPLKDRKENIIYKNNLGARIFLRLGQREAGNFWLNLIKKITRQELKFYGLLQI